MKTATMRKMESCVKDLKEMTLAQYSSEMFDMDSEGFVLAKKSIETIDTMLEFVMEEAETIQEINRKIDILLGRP